VRNGQKRARTGRAHRSDGTAAKAEEGDGRSPEKGRCDRKQLGPNSEEPTSEGFKSKNIHKDNLRATNALVALGLVALSSQVQQKSLKCLWKILGAWPSLPHDRP
jgi:hypothetical protein